MSGIVQDTVEGTDHMHKSQSQLAVGCSLIRGFSQHVYNHVQVYFGQFRKTPFGMLRLDPQDAGPGYRNVIGIPGGITSPLFRILQVVLPAHFCCMQVQACPGVSITTHNREVWPASIEKMLGMALIYSCLARREMCMG